MTSPTWQKIEEDFKVAFKKQDSEVLDILRLLKTALLNAEIEKRAKENNRQASLEESEVLEVLSRQVKSLEDALALFEQGKREDLVTKTKKEIEIIKKYLPAKLSPAELEKIIRQKKEELKIEGEKAFGQLMKEVMKEVKGRALGEEVSSLVKKILQEKS